MLLFECTIYETGMDFSQKSCPSLPDPGLTLITLMCLTCNCLLVYLDLLLLPLLCQTAVAMASSSPLVSCFVHFVWDLVLIPS